MLKPTVRLFIPRRTGFPQYLRTLAEWFTARKRIGYEIATVIQCPSCTRFIQVGELAAHQHRGDASR